jgi:hypothetical protein
MTRFALIGAAALLAAASATQAFAQAAIQEPGLYAFYHPDGDLLHALPPHAAASPQMTTGAMAEMRSPAHARRHLSRR